jgi:hypothetical protein
MARFYCNEAELADVVSRASKGMTEEASRLTFACLRAHEIEGSR